MSEKRYLVKGYGVAPNGENIFGIFDSRTKSPYHLYAFNDDGLNKIARIMNEQQATIQSLKEENEQLLRCKYFVKAVEVFTDCPISETIADYSDGELFDEEEQLEFGKKMLEQEKELVEDE